MVKKLYDRLEAKLGDITKEKCDAIVNAANSSLTGGGGVDGAIHSVGGIEILRECREIRKTQYPNGLPTGEAVITGSGKLKTKYVIHTVGPIWSGGKLSEKELLENCYNNSLELAVKHKIRTIAFPSISTGIYGYPMDKAAKVAYKTVIEFLSKNSFIDLVTLVFFSQQDMDVFLEAIT